MFSMISIGGVIMNKKEYYDIWQKIIEFFQYTIKLNMLLPYPKHLHALTNVGPRMYVPTKRVLPSK